MEVENEEAKTDDPTEDAFGSPLKEEEPQVVPEAGAEDKKKEDAPVVDIAAHPTVVEMKGKMTEQSEQLTNQGKLIRKQNAKIKALESGEGSDKEEEVDLPHPDIKRSKDLTEAERDEKTEDEIVAMDKLADVQEAANKAAIKAHKELQKAKKDAAKRKEEEDEEDDDSPKDLLEAGIKELSGGDAEKERELREAVKLTNFEGLKTKEEITERLKLGAEKFVPNWKPPKEQPTGGAGAAVKKGGDADDPHGNKKIVQEAREGSTGKYAL